MSFLLIWKCSRDKVMILIPVKNSRNTYRIRECYIHSAGRVTPMIMPASNLVLCQYLVQVKMRNFSHFNPPEAQPQCVFFHTIVRIHLVTYSYNGYEFVSYCRKLPDIRKSSGMLAYNHGF